LPAGLYFIRPFEKSYVWIKTLVLSPFSTLLVVGIVIPYWTNIPELLDTV
jgi:hypothetical protein